MVWKLDENKKEYTTAAGAARYLGMPRTTFLHYTRDEFAFKVPSKLLSYLKVFITKLILMSGRTKQVELKCSIKGQ
jgi:hypothetical protein